MILERIEDNAARNGGSQQPAQTPRRDSDTMGLVISETFSLRDNLCSPGKRQVGNVTPFIDPAGQRNVTSAPADPMSATKQTNPEMNAAATDGKNEELPMVSAATPKLAMLRLREFAVDPSSNQGSPSSPTLSTLSTASSSSPASSSWHLAQGQPVHVQPSVSSKVASFPEAASKLLQISFVLTATDRKQVANYSILYSSQLANLRLFVHADQRQELPATDDGWKDVECSFWPNEQVPDYLQLVFTRDRYRSALVWLPKQGNALNCIASRKMFAISHERFMALNRNCIRLYGMALMEMG